ncbi:MAG: helix-turn-helix transcriptional regulator [Lachnospiraceae bacterium]|nr:helix-turn-helix transcriptional regulator [Lachnospiraceae bacterium]
MECHERFRAIRCQACLSQWQVASLIHVTQRTYSDYESGRTRISIDIAIWFASKMNLSLDYVCGASDVISEFPKE